MRVESHEIGLACPECGAFVPRRPEVDALDLVRRACSDPGQFVGRDMASPEPDGEGQDSRWMHGMNGWRIQGFAGQYGEVTGWQPPFLWVVLDGEEDPRPFRWNEVRPA